MVQDRAILTMAYQQ